MNNNTFLALLIGATFGATGCADDTSGGAAGGSVSTPAKDLGDTLATVNGLKVGSEAFKAAAARKVPSNGKALSIDEKKDVLKRLVDEKLLYQAALKEGLDQDPKVQKVMVNTLLREAVYAKVKNSDFTDEALQGYFDEHQDEFVVPEKVQIKRILIKVTDERTDDAAKAEAGRIQAKLSKDASQFKDLANNHSEGPYKRRGGDVGFVPRDGKPGLDKSVVEEAFKLKVGDISDVFKNDEGYNVVMAANKRDKVERTFQQMKGSVLRKIKNEKLKSLYEGYVDGLREGASISTEDTKLDGIDVEPARAPKHPGMRMPTGGGPMGERGQLPGGIKPPKKVK
jgi:parvulin-like peptidyl-prolyl isomerase